MTAEVPERIRGGTLRLLRQPRYLNKFREALPEEYLNTENNGRSHWERGRHRPQPKVKTYSSLVGNTQHSY